MANCNAFSHRLPTSLWKRYLLKKVVYISPFQRLMKTVWLFFSLRVLLLENKIVVEYLWSAPFCSRDHHVQWGREPCLEACIYFRQFPLIKCEFLHLNWPVQQEAHKRLMLTTLSPHTNISLVWPTWRISLCLLFKIHYMFVSPLSIISMLHLYLY